MDLLKHFDEAAEFIADALAACQKPVVEHQPEETTIAEGQSDQQNTAAQPEGVMPVVDEATVEVKKEEENNLEKQEEQKGQDEPEEYHGCVLVHCSEGRSRSPSIILAYLLRYKNWTLKVNTLPPISIITYVSISFFKKQK